MTPPMTGVKRQHVGRPPRLAVLRYILKPQNSLSLHHINVHQIWSSVVLQGYTIILHYCSKTQIRDCLQWHDSLIPKAMTFVDKKHDGVLSSLSCCNQQMTLWVPPYISYGFFWSIQTSKHCSRNGKNIEILHLIKNGVLKYVVPKVSDVQDLLKQNAKTQNPNQASKKKERLTKKLNVESGSPFTIWVWV